MFQLDFSSTSNLPAIADGLPSNHIRADIPDGVAGTAATITQMQKLCSLGKRDFRVRKVLGKILNGEIPGIPASDPKDYLAYARAIYQFCRDEIKYVYDPSMVEYVESPSLLLESRIGDCDSVCTLMTSLWESAGFDAEYITIKADAERPNEFSHVYARVKVPGVGWINADPTMPKQDFGWEAPGNYPKQFWPASTDDLQIPLDTSPSVSEESVGSSYASSGISNNGINGLGGLADMMVLDGATAQMNHGNPVSTYHRPKGRAALARHSLRPMHSGIRGLGAEANLDPAARATLEDIWSGTAYANIKSALEQGFADQTEIYKYLSDSDPAKRALAEKARDANTRSLQALQQSKVYYNQIVNYIQTALGTIGQASSAPKTLGNLGIVGIDDLFSALVAAGVAVAVIVLLAELRDIFAVGMGASKETRGYLDQMKDLFGAIGDTAIKVGIVAGLGFIGYLIYKHKYARG